MKALAIVGIFTAGTAVPLVDDVAMGNGNTSNAQPADKVSVAGSDFQHMTVGHSTVQLFDAPIKTSGPTDLIVEVNAECGLWTSVTVVDDDFDETEAVDIERSEAEARVKIWALFDGVVVPVANSEERDVGQVVFCDRLHGITLTERDGDNDTEEMSNYLRTRAAQSFAWIILNTGEGTTGTEHTLEIWAQLDAQVNEGEGEAEAAIGKRTLIVEPTKLANNADLSSNNAPGN